jgi:hypothetical protein
VKPWPSGFSADAQTLVRYLVTYASGRHVTIMAANIESARLQAERLWPDDAVHDVRLW